MSSRLTSTLLLACATAAGKCAKSATRALASAASSPPVASTAIESLLVLMPTIGVSCSMRQHPWHTKSASTGAAVAEARATRDGGSSLRAASTSSRRMRECVLLCVHVALMTYPWHNGHHTTLRVVVDVAVLPAPAPAPAPAPPPAPVSSRPLAALRRSERSLWWTGPAAALIAAASSGGAASLPPVRRML